MRTANHRFANWSSSLQSTPYLVMLTMVGTTSVLRVAAAVIAGPSRQGDSVDYTVGFTVIGPKPAATNLLYALLGGRGLLIVTVQAVVGALCWAFLGYSVWQLKPASPWRWVLLSWILGISVTGLVAAWDSLLLSESLSLSFLVLSLALAIRVAEGKGGYWLFALVGSVGVWVFTKESNLLTVGAMSLIWVGWAVRRRIRVQAMAGGILVAICVVALILGQSADRWRVPTYNAYMRFVIGEARQSWFEVRGMPMNEEVADLGGQKYSLMDASDPRLAEWETWMDNTGRESYLLYLVTHPLETVGRFFSNSSGLLSNGMEDSPHVSSYPLTLSGTLERLLLVGTKQLALLAATVSLVLAVAARRFWAKFLVPVGVISFGWLSGLVAYHSDGIEAGRHELVPFIQTRVGLVVFVAMALVGLLGKKPVFEANPRFGGQSPLRSSSEPPSKRN